MLPLSEKVKDLNLIGKNKTDEVAKILDKNETSSCN